MANPGGVITRKDVIDDQALQWGEEYAKEVQKAIDKNKEFLAIIAQMSTNLQSLRGATNFNQLQTAVQNTTRTVQAGADVWREQIQIENALISTQRRHELATEATNRALVLEREQLRLTNQQVRNEVRDRNGLVGAYEKLNKKRDEAQKRLQNLLAAERQNPAEIRRATIEFQRHEQQLQAVNQATNNYQRNIGNYRSAFSGAMGVAKDLMGALGVVGGITAFVSLAKEIFATTKEINSMNIALKTVSNGTEDFANNQKYLKELAKKNGLEIKSLTKTYTQFYIAAKDKLSANEIKTIFDKVTKSASLMGLSVDQQEGAFLALQQMMSKGKVSAEELRGQLGERLPGAFGIMAKSMNVTEEKLGQLMKDGKVIASEVLPKFAIELEKTYGADKVDKIESIQAAQNRLSNAWVAWVEKATSSKSSGVAKTLQFLADNLEMIIKVVGYATGAFILYKTWLGIVTLWTSTLEMRTKSLAIAKGILNGTINLSTIALRVWKLALSSTGIGALVVLIGTAVAYFSSLKKSISETTEETTKATESFLSHRKRTEELKTTTDQLIKRYDELKKKTTLNKVEQEELNSIINQLIKTVPDAADKWDQYGKIIGVNTERVRDYILQNGVLNKETEKLQIEATETLLNTLNDQFYDWKAVRDDMYNSSVELTIEGEKLQFQRINGILKEGIILFTKATATQKIAFVKAGEDISFEIAKQQNLLNKLKGIKTADEIEAEGLGKKAEALQDSEKARKDREEREKKAWEEEKKRRAEYLKMLEKIEEAEFNLFQFRLQTSIETNNEILDDDKATFQEKINAINEITQLQESKANQILQHEIKTNALKAVDIEKNKSWSTQRYKQEVQAALELADDKYAILVKANDDIKSLSEDELNTFNKLSNTEKLLYEKWQKEKGVIEKNTAKQTEKTQKEASDKILEDFKKQVEYLKGIEKEKELLAQAEQDSLDKRYAQGKINKEQYEKEKFEIEHKYLLLSLNEQIEVIEKELEKLADTSEKKMILEEVLRDLKHKLSLANIEDIRKETDVVNENWNVLKQQASSLAKTLGDVLGFDSSNLDIFFNKLIGGFEKGEDGLMHWKSGFEDWVDIAKVSIGVVKDIANALFAGNIQSIQAEMDANEEYYSHQMELAGDDQRKKDDLQKEKDKKDKILKEKLNKEKEKQAIANRVMAVADIAINTAQGIMQIWAHSPDPTGISQGTMTAIISALGAIQIASVLAQPLPKYKHGRLGGPSEWAIVGDGGRSEVIERASGLVQMTPSTDTLVNLEQGDKVHSSVDKYYEVQQIAFQNDLMRQQKKAVDFQNYNYGKESLSVLKNIEKNLKNQKNTTIINVPKLDINHELWKMNNKKWN